MLAPITPEDLYRFRWLDHVRCHPREPLVAYQVSWADAEASENRSQIQLQGLGEQDQPVELTGGEGRRHSPQWSPDGGRLAFSGRHGPRDQVFVLDRATSEVRQLTSLPDGATHPRWSPDGSALAFLGRVLS